MLSSRTSTSLLSARKILARRAKSSSSSNEEAASAGGSLFAGVAATFGTYMAADFLSNFIQHPTQKVRVRVSSAAFQSVLFVDHSIINIM
jgi:DNA-binding transcriptional LysR family regulator